MKKPRKFRFTLIKIRSSRQNIRFKFRLALKPIPTVAGLFKELDILLVPQIQTFTVHETVPASKNAFFKPFTGVFSTFLAFFRTSYAGTLESVPFLKRGLVPGTILFILSIPGTMFLKILLTAKTVVFFVVAESSV